MVSSEFLIFFLSAVIYGFKSHQVTNQKKKKKVLQFIHKCSLMHSNYFSNLSSTWALMVSDGFVSFFIVLVMFRGLKVVCNNFEWLLGLHGFCQFLVPRFKIVTLVLSKGTVPSIMLFATFLTSQFTQLLKSEEYLEYWWYLHWSTRVFFCL